MQFDSRAGNARRSCFVSQGQVAGLLFSSWVEATECPWFGVENSASSKSRVFSDFHVVFYLWSTGSACMAPSPSPANNVEGSNDTMMWHVVFQAETHGHLGCILPWWQRGLPKSLVESSRLRFWSQRTRKWKNAKSGEAKFLDSRHFLNNEFWYPRPRAQEWGRAAASFFATMKLDFGFQAQMGRVTRRCWIQGGQIQSCGSRKADSVCNQFEHLISLWRLDVWCRCAENQNTAMPSNLKTQVVITWITCML